MEIYGITFDELELQYVEEIRALFCSGADHTVILKEDNSNEISVLFLKDGNVIKRLSFEDKIQLFKAVA